MPVERKKTPARSAAGVWISGGVGAAEEIGAPSQVNHQHSRPAAGGARGVDATARFAAEFGNAFPSFRASLNGQATEGER